jgi:exopolysaccharide production protein ExoZ
MRSRPAVTGRIHQLDAIRGLLAVGVMVYHFGSWSGAGIVTGLGTFGVYGFFVLSGFALEHVYGASFDARRFTVARVARLAPLWVVVVAATVAQMGGADPGRVALNLTGLFGFVHPGATSIVAGGWSIGIELVLYVVFAILAWRRLSDRSLAVVIVLAFALRLWYVGQVWPLGGTLADIPVWVGYTEAPAFVAFFVAGMGGARLAASGRLIGLGHLTFIVGAIAIVVVLFSSTPVERDLFVGRKALALVALVSVGIALAGSGPAWSGWLARVAGWLGDLSYGTYLLFPLVWSVLAPQGLGPWMLVVTPLLALAVHRGFEVPVGRRIRSGLGSLGRRPGRATEIAPESPAGGVQPG